MSNAQSLMIGKEIPSDWTAGLIAGDADAVIAIDRGESLSRALLRQRVSHWCGRIQAQDNGAFWVLYNPDALEFSAQLLALWFSGKTVCLPGDNLPETQARLQPRIAGALGDWQGALMEEVTAGTTIPPPVFSYPAPDAAVVEVYTSGSTGEPQAIGKRLDQLTTELQVHARHWPYHPDAVVLSTVSHQHIYGLLFRILRPLVEGVPFERRLCHHLEDLQVTAGCYRRATLITSPSHLERLPDTAQWRALAVRWHRVFSSTAPLKRETSLRAQALLDSTIVEIYGSSETGGIAWRIQKAAEDSPWRPLSGIELGSNDDQLLMLHSPHLPNASWYTQPDRIEWIVNGKQFRLLGRVDRIAKVEGKRVSLTAMEANLASNSEIAAAHVLVLSRRRDEVGAVLILTGAGKAAVHEAGQNGLLRRLKAGLSASVEAVALPRRWRIVEALPWNAQGKLTQQGLKALFDTPPPDKPELPTVISCECGESEVTLMLHIPENLLYFDGHFDAAPILPGVVQLHWAQQLAREYFAEWFDNVGHFVGMERIKFQQLVRPGMTVALRLALSADKEHLAFSYRDDTWQFSSGRIRYAEQ